MKISAELGWALCVRVLLLHFMLRSGLNSHPRRLPGADLGESVANISPGLLQIVRVSSTHTTALSSIPLLIQVEDTENCCQEDPDMHNAARRINLYMNP